MDDLLHFEDFPVGEEISYGAYEVTAEEIKEFAAQYDPQPFHLDEYAGELSIAGALSSSGWHTLAMTMRMMCDGYLNRSASMGSFGVDEVKWVKPVLAGDILTVQRKTLDARVSASRPDMGVLTFQWQVFNQNDVLKLTMRGNGLVKVRGLPS